MKIDMRDAFFERLVEVAKLDNRIVFLTADHGAFALKEFEETMPDRYINVGISEQSMVGVSAGLAASGKIVFAYGISPFVSLKVMEQLTLDVAAMQLPVNIVSVGAGFTYSTDGPTHHGLQDLPAVLTVPNLTVLNSSDPINTRAFVDLAVSSQKPHYIRIEKERLPCLPREHGEQGEILNGFSILKKGDKNLLIISTGAVTHIVLECVYSLEKNLDISLDVIDLHRVKPLPLELITRMKEYEQILTIEEGYLSGMSQYILGQVQNEIGIGNVHSLGIHDAYIFQADSRGHLTKSARLDVSGINDAITKILKREQR